jgi:predicted nucleic acid-binding protein
MLSREYAKSRKRARARLGGTIARERASYMLKRGGRRNRLRSGAVTRDDCTHYAAIRHDLEAQGAGIGPMDTLIAAQALRLGATIVTRNVREFSRVPGLRVENWQD